jgi:hypothetical protein
MLAHIALFELHYQLRRPITWISFAIFALLAYGLIASMGPHGNPNSPFMVTLVVGVFSILAMFLSIATIADVVLRDNDNRMDAILLAMPVRTSVHYGPRFAGAYVVAATAFLGVMIGCAAGAAMPWVSAGAFQLHTYAIAFAVMALPTLFATGAIVFTVATLTRRLMATYLVAVVLLALAMAAGAFTDDYRIIAALLDPFAMQAFVKDLQGWSDAERAFRSIPLDGLLLWNRLFWTGIGCVLLVLSFTLFSARERRPPAARADAPVGATPRAMLDRPAFVGGAVSAWDQFVLRTRYETSSILRSWAFIVLLILGLLIAALTLVTMSLVGTVANPADTRVVVKAIVYAFGLITVLLPIAYSGELIWRDRDAKIAQIIDATVAPNIVFLASKIIATTVVIVALLTIAITTGIVFQLLRGAESIDVGLYLIRLGMFVGLPALLYGVLAVFVQTVVNGKFAGLLIMLAVLCVMTLAPAFVDNPLLLLFTIPDPGISSDYSAYIPSFLVAGYWTSIALLIAIASHLLWVRGTASLWARLERVYVR